jgi:YbgC/YbaW family acyl-CoA thioester hydrolase
MRVLFEKNILISFSDADPQGILFYARTYTLAHNCLEEFWAQNTLGWPYWFQNPEFAVPIRHSSCEYLLPIRAGEKYRLHLSLLKLSQSSVQFLVEFYDCDKAPRLCAKLETVHVFVDRINFSKISVPEKVKQVLSSSI